MGLALAKLVGMLCKPPAINIALALAAALLARRARRTARALLVASIASLWVASLPIVADRLLRGVETARALDLDTPAARAAGAIVLLAGGRRRDAEEFGGDTVSRHSLERLRYAARLHRRIGLPVLVSGGAVHREPDTEAALIRDVLVEEFGVAVRWLEDRSRNTAENAAHSATLLEREGIRDVLLVTHGAHMRRSMEAFERTGLRPVPAPTVVLGPPMTAASLEAWIPTAGALVETTVVIHEHLGRLWYWLRS